MKSHSLPVTSVISEDAPVRAEAASLVPAWCGYVVIFGATSIAIGLLWDISWHRSIGRDTFWTPAHMAIYLGGVLGGLVGGWLILRTHFCFAAEETRDRAVNVLGFRAPLGAWVSVWGALAMITSAPFDDWWHNAYGLDVKIISPPHSVLAAGMWALVTGALLLVLRERNVQSGARGVWGKRLYLYGSGVLLAMGAVMTIEHSFPNDQHSWLFYQISGVIYPFYLLGLAMGAKARWAGTVIGLVYMLIIASMLWILPLFPAQPMLGPVYNPIDSMVPLPFPLLLVIPGFALDLLRRWTGSREGWRSDLTLILFAAPVFLLTFGCVQWFFSEFLIGPGGHNAFFGADRHWGYPESPGAWQQRFWREIRFEGQGTALFRNGAITLVLTWVSCAFAVGVGRFLIKVKR